MSNNLQQHKSCNFFLTLILAQSLFITCLITHRSMNRLRKKYLVLLELTPWLFSRFNVKTYHFPSLFTWPPTLAWQINFSNRLRLQDISRLAFRTAISPKKKCYISYNLITPFLIRRDGNLTRTSPGPGRTRIIRYELNPYQIKNKSGSGCDFANPDVSKSGYGFA